MAGLDVHGYTDPRYSLFLSKRRAQTYAFIDCPSQIPTHWWRRRFHWGMAILVHHCLCRRDCYRKNWLENMDLATCCLHFNHSICLLHVSWGKHVARPFYWSSGQAEGWRIFQTGGKSLEEIDMLFAVPRVRDPTWITENGNGNASDSKESATASMSEKI